jgi:hypothetical protein
VRTIQSATPPFWAIAQVRWPRRRAAADCCFQRLCLQPLRIAASDPRRPAARATQVRPPPPAGCSRRAKARSQRSWLAG